VKKCSKSSHTALSELNITPLLDLAFVLLVIFVLTTSPVTNDMPLNLPKAATRPKQPAAKVHFVTVDAAGKFFLNRGEVDLQALYDKVVDLRTDDPDLNIVLRGDAKAPYKQVRAALDTLQQCNVAKVRLATDAFNGPVN
jgi:biopolymer transport protein ExbD